MSSSSPTHRYTKAVIFGATGAIGTSLAQSLPNDWSIEAVTRSPGSPSRLSSLSLPNLKMVEGDPFDKESVLSVTKDCDYIFCCIGFHKYETKYWAKSWPLVIDNLLAAVLQPRQDASNSTSKRKMVFCDNLYAYGADHSEPMTPETTTVPAHLKGKPNVRSFIRARMQEHMRIHPGTLTAVAGSDFFGPFVTDKSFLGDVFTGKIVQGQAALAVGSVDVVHDFCYAHDFGAAMATVATATNDKKAWDRFWICPHSIHDKTMQEIANDVARNAGQSTPAKISPVLTKFILRLLSPFIGFMGEMLEMYPNWSKPYRVDDSEFCTTFDVQPTPYDQALQATVDFYQQQNKTESSK